MVVVVMAALAGCGSDVSKAPPVCKPSEVSAAAASELCQAPPAASAPAPVSAPATGAADAQCAAGPTLSAKPVCPVPSTRPVYSGQREPVIVASSMLQVNECYLTVHDILMHAREEFLKLPKTISEDLFRRQAQKIVTNEIRRQTVDVLVYAEADRRLVDKQKEKIDEEVQETLRQMIAEAGGSRKKLEAIYAAQGATLEWIIDRQKRELTIRLYLHAKFMPSITLTRRDLWEYFVKNRQQYATPGKVQMQTIQVPLDKFLPAGAISEVERPKARDRARESVGKAMGDLRAGKEFADVAQEYSKGVKGPQDGLWPLMPAGSFKEAKVEEAAFALEEGQVSDVIETPEAFWIVKAVKVEKGSSLSFEDAQPAIEKKLKDMRYRQATEEYFENLMEKAFVRQSPQFMQLAVDEAVKMYYRK